MYRGQWKQDKFLEEYIFSGKRDGFFVEVGAYDGLNGSNTYFFEKERGWNGICIEPNSDIFPKLKINRNCVCLNVCAYKENKIIQFNKIDGHAEMLSGIDESYNERHRSRVKEDIILRGGRQNLEYYPSFRLDTIFENLKVNSIDLLCIDTEGSELDILKGIDFNKVDISTIVIEENYSDLFPICHLITEQGYSLINKFTTDIYDYLMDKNYRLYGKIGGDCIYVKDKK